MKIEKTCEQFHQEVLDYVKDQMANCDNSSKICIVQVGNNPASNAYVRGKLNDLDYVGIPWELRKLSVNVNPNDFADVLTFISNSSDYSGVIVQLPLPEHIVEAMSCEGCTVSNFIRRTKDIDGFVPDSKYTPCTPKGIMMWLDENNVIQNGKTVTIINRSKIVGQPLAKLMQERNATVTVAHSHTDIGFIKDILLPNSDIVVVGVGKPGFIQPQDVCGETLVIDVGINRKEDGKLCGDCAPDLGLRYGYQTPVPKGVGLLTRAAFVMNCFESL